jgi:hypothetical protein
MIVGQPKFTGLVIGELTINKMAPTTKITAKAAFVDPNTGVTYGWTTAEGALWSKETLEKLNELTAYMEADIARIHFADGGSSAGVIGAPILAGPAVASAGGGLGEHLGTDAPSV